MLKYIQLYKLRIFFGEVQIEIYKDKFIFEGPTHYRNEVFSVRKNKIQDLFFLVLRGLDFDSRIMDHYKGIKNPEKLNKKKNKKKIEQ